MKITYQECKGRLYPVVENEKGTEGKYAYERQIYLKTQKTKLFHDLLTNGQLAKELAQTQKIAMQREEELIQKMAQQEGLAETFKKQQPLLWIQRMNNIRQRAEEIVRAEQIYR